MCIHPPCESCHVDYDACFEKCPECGHPNPSGGAMAWGMSAASFNYSDLTDAPNLIPEPKEKEVCCEKCQEHHTITVYEEEAIKKIKELTKINWNKK